MAKTQSKKVNTQTSTNAAPAVFVLPQDSFAHSGLEVYSTNDKNVEKTSKDEEKEGFVLQNGTITEIAYFDEIVSDSFEQDYEDISCNGSVSFVSVDETRFYKGKKVFLKKGYNASTWNHLESCLLGFITEQTYSEDGVDIKISGASKLLEQEKQFNYNDTKISKILKEMIESAGLKANINTDGLKDFKVDYSNVSSNSSSSGLAGGQGKTIDDLVAGWVGSETDELKKAELIHNGLRDDVGIWYAHYNNSRYHTAEKCLENHKHLNCGDTSILTVACMKSGGLNAYTALRCDREHFFTVILIGGTKYYSDLVWSEGQRSQRPFNETWQNNKCGSEYDLK